MFSKHRGEKGPGIENETVSKRNTFNENLKDQVFVLVGTLHTRLLNKWEKISGE